MKMALELKNHVLYDAENAHKSAFETQICKLKEANKIILRLRNEFKDENSRSMMMQEKINDKLAIQRHDQIEHEELERFAAKKVSEMRMALIDAENAHKSAFETQLCQVKIADKIIVSLRNELQDENARSIMMKQDLENELKEVKEMLTLTNAELQLRTNQCNELNHFYHHSEAQKTELVTELQKIRNQVLEERCNLNYLYEYELRRRMNEVEEQFKNENAQYISQIVTEIEIKHSDMLKSISIELETLRANKAQEICKRCIEYHEKESTCKNI